MNDLEVTGPAKEIKRFKEQSLGDKDTKNPEDPENMFAQFVPMPKDIFTGNVGQDEEKKYGKKTWYTWCPNNWGTKWDACECHISLAKTKKLIYVFDTAWSPPIQWLEKVAAMYPKLKFVMNYDEPGMVFSGTATGENGLVFDDYREGISPSNDEMQDEENLEEARNLEKSK